jgi:hypothetical protein
MKTSHFEGSIASWVTRASLGRKERTQRELAAFDLTLAGNGWSGLSTRDRPTSAVQVQSDKSIPSLTRNDRHQISWTCSYWAGWSSISTCYAEIETAVPARTALLRMSF